MRYYHLDSRRAEFRFDCVCALICPPLFGDCTNAHSDETIPKISPGQDLLALCLDP